MRCRSANEALRGGSQEFALLQQRIQFINRKVRVFIDKQEQNIENDAVFQDSARAFAAAVKQR